MLIHRIYTLYVITYTAAENFLSHFPIWPPKAAALPPVLPSKVDNISQRCISMSLSIPRGKAFIRYSFRLTWRFEMKKDSLT